MDSAIHGRLTAEREAGLRAQRLLDDMAPVLAAVEADCMRIWRDANTTELREAAWHRVKALENIAAHLKRAIEGAKLAEHRLNAPN